MNFDIWFIDFCYMCIYVKKRFLIDWKSKNETTELKHDAFSRASPVYIRSKASFNFCLKLLCFTPCKPKTQTPFDWTIIIVIICFHSILRSTHFIPNLILPFNCDSFRFRSNRWYSRIQSLRVSHWLHSRWPLKWVSAIQRIAFH